MARTASPLAGLFFMAALALLVAAVWPATFAALQSLEATAASHVAQESALKLSGGELPAVRPLPEIGTKISHALDRHPVEEVEAVRQCFIDRGGTHFIVKEELFDKFGKHRTRFHLLCLTLDGTWTDRIVEKVEGVWQEITAFVPKDGTLPEIQKWLSRKIVQLWKKPLP